MTTIAEKPVNYTEVFAPVTTWAKDALTIAQRNFNKNPNAFHWNMCIRAMFIHQQMSIAVRSPLVNRSLLSRDLDNNPIGMWPDLISIATTGKEVRELLTDDFAKVGHI
jgi:hypothetical protein